ncbi:MAG: phosphoribosylglycinamide formyltransferase [Aestuariibacter sp.]
MSKNIVVLISGSGSNLQAIIDAINAQQINGSIKKVISNKPEAYGLIRAFKSGIPDECIDHRKFESRQAFDQALMKSIDKANPDIVVLAGFMRILTDEFVEHYLGRMINIHPSLLPKFKGLHTHKRAIEAGEKEHGASVHFVTPALDDGPVIIQAAVRIDMQDTADSLQKKVFKVEHQIYPEAIKWLCEDRIALTAQGVTLDSTLLSESGFRLQALD